MPEFRVRTSHFYYIYVLVNKKAKFESRSMNIRMFGIAERGEFHNAETPDRN